MRVGLELVNGCDGLGFTTETFGAIGGVSGLSRGRFVFTRGVLEFMRGCFIVIPPLGLAEKVSFVEDEGGPVAFGMVIFGGPTSAFGIVIFGGPSTIVDLTGSTTLTGKGLDALVRILFVVLK